MSTAALVAGVTLLIIGTIFAVALGPSGRVEATSRVAAPGVVLLDKDVLRASSAPVHVSASSPGGPVTMVRMLDDDARAALDSSRHTLVGGVSFLPRSLRATERRDGPLPRSFNADTFLASPVTAERVDVDIPPSRLPQALVVFPGKLDQAREDALDVSLTWENAAWFWQAVVVALAGAALLTGGTLMRRRRGLPAPDAPQPRRESSLASEAASPDAASPDAASPDAAGEARPESGAAARPETGKETQ